MHNFRGKCKKRRKRCCFKIGEEKKEKWGRQTSGPERRTRKIRGL